MATGCCGVKKQKLNNASAAGNSTSMNCYNSDNKCNGALVNGLSTDAVNRSNGGCANNMINGTANGQLPSAGRKRPAVINVEMVHYCFDVLYSYLNNTESPKTPTFSNDHFPLFVTWKLGKDRKLRGCIGTFTSTSLHQGLREYAITSACKDSRFDPIHVDEFARLHCSVSLLTDFEMAENYLDWVIGVHGIRIEFNNEKGSKKAATYLPEVAVEQGWTQIQTIDSLLRKGGFKGTITPDVRNALCLVRFQSEKMTISYQEYIAHKQQAQECGGLPSKAMSNGVDVDLNDSGSRYHRNDVSANHTTSSMNGTLTNGTSAGGSGYHYHQNRLMSNSVTGRHSLHNHRSNSRGGSGDHYSATMLKDGSHQSSANTARYLPLPNHPYMPPPF